MSEYFEYKVFRVTKHIKPDEDVDGFIAEWATAYGTKRWEFVDLSWSARDINQSESVSCTLDDCVIYTKVEIFAIGKRRHYA